MRQQDDDFLAHKMQVLTALLAQRPPNLAGINQEVYEEAELSSTSPSPFFLRVLDRNDRLVAETPSMAAMLPLSVFSGGACVAGARSALSLSRGPLHFLCAARSVPTAGPGGMQWRIQAA